MKLLRSILLLLAALITAMSLYSNIDGSYHNFHQTTIKASQQHSDAPILSEGVEISEGTEESDVEHFLVSWFVVLLSQEGKDTYSLRALMQQRRYINAVANSSPRYLLINHLAI